MPISTDAHVKMVKAAYGYRLALVQAEEYLTKMIQEIGRGELTSSPTQIANMIHSYIYSGRQQMDNQYIGALDFALLYYTPSKIKYNDRKKTYQAEQRANQGVKPLPPRETIVPDLTPVPEPEPQEPSEETKERYAAWLKSQGH